MAITVTSLLHPTMIAKIRLGLRYAALGKGHEMGGHANHVYITNSKGRNIMRIDWKVSNGTFVAWGGSDWGMTDVTDIVKEAIQRGCSAKRVKPRHPVPRNILSAVSFNSVVNFLAIASMSALIVGCQTSGAMPAMLTVVSGFVP